MTVSIFKDANTGNWWLQVEDDAIGYWPNSLVSGIADGAEMVQYGGEIFDVATEVGTAVAHTTTEMGSGHFPSEGERKASVFTNVQVLETTQTYKSPPLLKTSVGNPNCYDLQVRRSDNWGVYFFYGGPGRNPNCN
ncbi:hypothetical protein QJS04_geneDACA018109 [Acorus gramineus]|uniref:Neprosin PEP catalytic domain-containing protein n=1 Tax=Acorus gramineus TaxID=55184 RepID=A0AAV9AKI0_ACOGR|nr:hypothetical protein QJS04_geneDACA018109 [Acorus gramineus]